MSVSIPDSMPETNLSPSPPSLADARAEMHALKDKDEYQRKLKKWQKRLLQVQQAYYHQNRRALIILEGWDASGKGGTIRRITQRLDPRGFRVYPISAPTAAEQSRHYLYRFQKRLPPAGRMAIFDRSYYGRVLVERVEGVASESEWKRAYGEINAFERMLTDDGARIVKLFLHITPEEQLRRFEQRMNDPVKHWKLTEEDIRNRKNWNAYEAAVNDMFRLTSSVEAPWHMIDSNHKWYTRIRTLKTLVKALTAGVDISPQPLQPEVLHAAEKHLGITPDD